AAALLGPRARFVSTVAHDEMPKLLGRHRVAIGQFRVGAVGQFELEAMACATPVVADFRFPGAYGTPPPIEPARDADEVAGAVGRLLDEDGRREHLGHE